MAVVEQAIVTRLEASTSVTSLASTRIYPNELPQDATLPAIVYDLISSVRESESSADSGDVHARIQVTSWAKTYSAASGLSEGVRSALQRWCGPTTGLGSVELVDNGGFASTDGWTFGGAWSLASGGANHSGSPGGVLSRSINALPGERYQLTYTVSNTVNTGGTMTPSLGGANGDARSSTGGGTFSDDITMGSSGSLAFTVSTSGPFWVGKVDDISVKRFKHVQEIFIENEFSSRDDDTGDYAHSLDLMVHFEE